MTMQDRLEHHGEFALRPVRTLAVVGAGTMGTGISITALDVGLEVTLLEQAAAALQRGATRIREHYARRVAAGKVSAGAAAACESQLHATTDWNALAQIDLVVEAVFEDMAVKREVFARLDRIARPGTILATNTSYLDVDAIAGTTSRPRDVVGLHFFSPANVMRLVEVVRGAATSPEVQATAVDVARRQAKPGSQQGRYRRSCCITSGLTRPVGRQAAK